MSETEAQFVSDVRVPVNANKRDMRISAQYIHSVAKDVTRSLIVKRPSREFMRDTTIQTEIDCVEMERILSDKCDLVEFRKCEKVMRSKCKLPQVYVLNKTGPGIIDVRNINGTRDYDPIRNLADFALEQQREFGSKAPKYYLSGGYLYVVGATPELVSVTALFADALEAKLFSSCSTVTNCESALEQKIMIPGGYIDDVKTQVISIISGVKRAIPEDENSNMDSNQNTGA
jgi:hypothetical protein